jgi:hypothetical protein
LFLKLGSDQYRAHWFIYVNYFRIGNFNEARKDIKDAWFHFCGNILPQLNKNWKSKVVQSNKLLSDVCTVSDEAYAYQIGKTNIHFWMKRLYYKQHQRFIDWQELEPLNPKRFRNQSSGMNEGLDAFKEGKHGGARAEEFDESEDEKEGDDDDVGNSFEDANAGSEDEDADNNEDEDEDGYGAKKVLKKKKHVDSDHQHDANNLEDREVGVELAKDKIDSKAYYACYHVLYNQKLSNLDAWRSWDTAYKNCIAIPKHQKQRTTPSVASSSLSSESKEELIVDETHEIHFEKWC